MKKLLVLYFFVFMCVDCFAEDGYALWLRYAPVKDKATIARYTNIFRHIYLPRNSPTVNIIHTELTTAYKGFCNGSVITNSVHPSLVIGQPKDIAAFYSFSKSELEKLGNEGFIISTKKINGKDIIFITGNTDIALLYGTFHFLRVLQTTTDLNTINITEKPKLTNRVLNHWDNLDRYIERGYAGISIFDWHTLPGYIDQRYIDYARANASIGINGTALTNVGANAQALTPTFLLKVKALADVFRPYGIKVYLTARFSAPVEIGKLKDADPLNEEVKLWWKQKADEIYALIPDFGGFLVKANSEGQPGPQNYGRTHADGANMLADALAPHNGIVMWRCFVYNSGPGQDRFKQSFDDFKPLDGQFKPNVILQVKNGPIDFQPREPFHPLFGGMTKTPLVLEFQLTQEYLGFATHLVYLPLLQKEVLDADTYANGKGSTVATIIETNVNNSTLTGVAGVANIGNDINWCGHPFAQANWYGFGRLAWNNTLTPQQIADEWIGQTFSTNEKAIAGIKKIMLASREAVVNYMTPLGLHHIMGYGSHYGPAPWYDKAPRADWNPVYFHKADSAGIGYERTINGSNALSQYKKEVAASWQDEATCDERYLLWFHHVSWKHVMKSGNTLWEELCKKYNDGVEAVQQMREDWKAMKPYIDEQRFNQVTMLLDIQYDEAKWWREACVQYFQTFSRMPVPAGYPAFEHTLQYYQSLQFPFAPGDGR